LLSEQIEKEIEKLNSNKNEELKNKNIDKIENINIVINKFEQREKILKNI